MDWLRWHHGTVVDPKWRCIAAETGAKVGEVVAVWACMLEHASQAEKRGTLEGWRDKVYAMVLDLKPETVTAIRQAMDELVLSGEEITAWAKRQPSSADRVKKHRALQKRDVTPVTPREDESREEEIQKKKLSIHPSAGVRLDMSDEEHISFVIRLANRGMRENPAIDQEALRVLMPSHPKSRQAVADWRAAGVEWSTIEATVYDRASKYPPGGRYQQIGTLTYFDKAIAEAHESQEAMMVSVPSIDSTGESDDRIRHVPSELREWAERLDAKLHADELAKGEAERVLAHLRAANEQETRRMRVAERDAFLWIRLLNWYGERVGDPKPNGRKVA